MEKAEIRQLAEMGVALALAVILNYLKLFEMPQGGSVSLEMLPVIFIALRWGWRKGVLLGVGYGLLQAMLGGYVVHWVQLLLDYPLAYGGLGFAGLLDQFNKVDSIKGKVSLIIGGVTLGGFLRFLTHFLSGLVFFGHYAPENQAVWVYSLIYNASYLIPEIVITALAMGVLIKVVDNNPALEN